ncbi:lipoprotein insertase outer membrane protein LolB [Thermomonas sp.]|uniref:lipoprotein insertase outer membrane protein LolB n=1 Tax=Thermomonas sp. TaxID=1971895 RepID=UPI002488E9C6|nr:lipoprotein insertase outer membrane protein LolB [Thermomonas sp.]MDI1254448.1 lipoprotein insertase outer membrane protein LolB [Thermomonas sp.]
MIQRIGVAALCLLLAACQSMPPAAAPTNVLVGDAQVRAAKLAQKARIAALGLGQVACDAPAWTMLGRVALSNGKDGGSGRIEWTQGAGRTEVTLSAPVTRQSWTLTADADGVALEGVSGGPLRGTDAGQLLRQSTGWEIPVAALGCWLRGAPAESGAMGEASSVFGIDTRLLRIEQGGWVIDYSNWQPDPDSGVELPTRINAEQASNRVRLVVDRWDKQ